MSTTQMVFSSVVFLFIFLPLTLIVHYFLDPRYRNFFLLLVSLVFYSWGEGLLTILILLSIAINYAVGLKQIKADPVAEAYASRYF